MSGTNTGPETQAGDDVIAELADDFLRRHRAGERPSVDEYATKHPELADRIRALFPAMMAIEQPAGATFDFAPPTERVGATIGRYKLLEQIGEGGFGVVYMAEQQQPVRRKVALKIIKPGMDTRQVIARFEAERQALSMMDHPNIAKVLDAGTTDSGRPYFVMELVKGQPITQYCDENHLTPRERLELLLPVCQAIQHAHQKGIIHRDIKPTNILVAEYDQHPIPKVIDFGVAKAIGSPLSEKTMFTGFGQIVGTLEYMSPEQAKVNQLDIDTRSDIYSLGVLLYELLTGSTPFDKDRLRSAAWDEMLRIIREEEPPRPSTKLSSSETLPSIAANRSMEPARLSRTVRGELDWIVMKALEKDRNRRYETANGFAMDLQRYLSDELVLACPPSAGYRLRKFAARNKAPLVTVTAIAATLVVASIVSTSHAVRATQARADAEAATAREAKLRHDAEWREKSARAQSFVVTGHLDKAEGLVRELPEEFIGSDARTIAPILRALAQWHAGEQRWQQSAAYYNTLLFGPGKQSADFYDNFVHATEAPSGGAQAVISPPWSLTYLEFAPLLIELNDLPGYRRLCQSAIERYAETTIPNFSENMLHVTLLVPPDRSQMTTISRWAEIAGTVDHNCYKIAVALFHYRQGNDELALEWCWKCLGARPYPGVAARGHVLQAMAYLRLNNHDDAKKELARGREMIEEKFRGHLGIGHYGGNLWADWLMDRILLREADAMFQARAAGEESVVLNQGGLEKTLREFRRQADSPEGKLELSRLLIKHAHRLGEGAETDKAMALLQEAEGLEASAQVWSDIGNAYSRFGRWDKATAAFRKAIELDPKSAPAHNKLGNVLGKQKKFDEAAAAFRKSIELDPKSAPTHNNLGNALRSLKKPDEAIAAYEEAIRLQPDDTTMRFVLASALAESEQWDRSATVYAEGLKRIGPQSWPGPWYEAIRSEELFTRLTALRPDDSLLWIMHARLSALERNWKRAAADYSRVKGSLGSGDGAFEYAASRLLVDDRSGYEQFCKQWADRVSRAKGLDYSLARSFAITPGSLVPSGQIVEWARTAVQSACEPWHLHVLSLAHYRNGEFDLAIAHAQESNAGYWRGSAKALNWLVLAMAHHRLGHAAEARKSLKQAFQLAAQAGPVQPAGAQWPDMAPPDVMEFELLRREAENLIDPKPTPKPDTK